MAEELAGDTGTEAPDMDMDAAVDSIGADLGFDKPDATELEDTERDAGSEAAPEAEAKEVPRETRSAPKSWARETHELWAKLDPKAQDQFEKREKDFLDGLEQYKGDAGFGKQMKDVMTPYRAILQSQGVDEPKAVEFLLNAHYKLSTAPAEERKSYFAKLAKSYGIELGLPEETPMAPEVKGLTDRMNAIESSLTTREQAALSQARTKVAMDVEAFASDKAHPYFDEVADDIIAMIHTGADLKDAYEKAVWANPVTRAKEMARIQTENEAKLRENARLDALKARKSAGSNVRTRETERAPTEQTGKLFSSEHEEEMRETVRRSNTRTH